MIIFADWASVDGNGLVEYAEFMEACQSQGSRLGGVILRGAYGTLPDPTLRQEWTRAKNYGFTAGAYLFLRSRKDQSPIDQVHAFATNQGTVTRDDLVPTIDVEDHWPAAEAELEAVHTAWREMVQIYGVPPMLYDSGRVWTEDLHNLPAGEMIDSPQWVAKPWPWAIRQPAVLAPGPFESGKYDPIVPKPWGPGNWWLHQYQGDALPVPGFTSTVDLSRFHLMTQGETGPRVAWVQRRLGLPRTSVFDAEMSSRLRAYQTQQGLVADAVVGPQTFKRICWTPSPAACSAASTSRRRQRAAAGGSPRSGAGARWRSNSPWTPPTSPPGSGSAVTPPPTAICRGSTCWCSAPRSTSRTPWRSTARSCAALSQMPGSTSRNSPRRC